MNQLSFRSSSLTSKDSIQAAIAGEAHISSLRIVDIFLSSASQTAGVDVWFVMLQKPRLDMGEATPSGACKYFVLLFYEMTFPFY